MRLIITRPRTDAEPLAARLESLGHSCIIMPLLDIVPRTVVSIPKKNYQAICITSANGILFDEPVRHLHATPVYCVGPQSAAAAEAKGFLRVAAQGGDVAGLSAFILHALKPADGPILYLSGAATSGDLHGTLSRAGYETDRVVTYDAVAIAPQGLADAVTMADGVLLYSPRTARLWQVQVEKAAAGQHIRAVMHYCLSPAVAAKLPPDWRKCSAKTPDEPGLLAVLSSSSFDRT